MLRTTLALVGAVALAGTALAHPCDADAKKRGAALLAFHYADGGDAAGIQASVDDTVKQLAPIKALKGKGKLDVLEVIGYVYKAEYRMHFIYAQIPDSCALMGQEIIELSDPY